MPRLMGAHNSPKTLNPPQFPPLALLQPPCHAVSTRPRVKEEKQASSSLWADIRIRHPAPAWTCPGPHQRKPARTRPTRGALSLAAPRSPGGRPRQRAPPTASSRRGHGGRESGEGRKRHLSFRILGLEICTYWSRINVAKAAFFYFYQRAKRASNLRDFDIWKMEDISKGFY